ncbi:MAG: hypothetical protein SOU80_04940, partial [Alphaproteobacteria bacterium]|nr:hypothetical protein [Alphaproteobacteria bacterium]
MQQKDGRSSNAIASKGDYSKSYKFTSGCSRSRTLALSFIPEISLLTKAAPKKKWGKLILSSGDEERLAVNSDRTVRPSPSHRISVRLSRDGNRSLSNRLIQSSIE